MPVKFEKKSRKQQGNRTRGYGTIGAHRAKGQRGGSGLTTGKFKHKWSLYLKMKKLGFPGPDGEKWKIGKKGFKQPPQVQRLNQTRAINLKDIEEKLPTWLEAGKIEQKGGKYIINLGALNYNKLLGKGKVTKNLEISVERASALAVEKMKEAKAVLKLTARSEES
ncbi:uL15m family ribosomal protein [Candidatus Harpocratesius sp.]